MRLLNVEHLKFCEFDSDADAPKYAIASHKWDRDEATLDDIHNGRNTHKRGYEKVLAFAKYVKKNIASVKWVWVDTCCINKDSSAELSEAINSMFKWYRNAEVCLAYLGDVSVGDDSFQQSNWFKRGWTLQELLAPRTVVFLTKEWEVIGYKGGNGHSESGILFDTGPPLETTIADITRIPESVLRDYTQSYSCNIKQKLGWANGRKTTRPEDMSYCLFGIFDVSMAVIYGEGGERAKQRLDAEIYRDRDTINGLPTAGGATHNSYDEGHSERCLEGTRVHLLDQIYGWAKDANSKRIFWLCGAAGTGKSTISRTVADRLDRENGLGASFFFKRGGGDRSSARRFFPTIARQLAGTILGFDTLLAQALENDGELCEKTLQDQFEKLLLQPLQSHGWSTPHATIVVDALDECESGDEIKIIVNLLARDSVPLRVFVTSRPELPVRLGFRDIATSLHQDIILEDVQATVIEHDIRTYFTHRFREIKTEDTKEEHYGELPTDWPSEASIEALVQLAIPLFIFAFTICRYISESDPERRLETMLQQRKLSGLDRTYLPILNQLIPERDRGERADALADFRDLVGPIVLLADSLSARSLSNLLQIPLRAVSKRLRYLHSVLSIPKDPDKSIRIHHLSFRDFLIDPQEKDAHQFWIDRIQTHNRLALHCIRRLNTLRLNLCRIAHPGVKRAEISKQKIVESIAADIAYACCYWVSHLAESKENIRDNDYVHQFLQSHLLHWLEALSWLGRLSAAITHITTLQSLVVKGEQGIRLHELLEDARRFVLRNRYIVDLAPLQLYLSALVFTPSKSIVRQTFSRHTTKLLNRLPAVPLNWGAEILKLEGHDKWVTAIAFSPDGQAVVSASQDGAVRLWDARTGEATRTLETHSDSVTAVAFSSDGRAVLSGSDDGMVRLWDARTVEEIQAFKGNSDEATSVALSPNGRAVALASRDSTVWLWDVRTGKAMWTLEGHSDAVTSVAFSSDGRAVVSASQDGTVRLWDVRTGEAVSVFKEHNDGFTSVAFSPDGRAVASASQDGTVHLWDARTGKATRTLAVYSVEFVGKLSLPHGRGADNARTLTREERRVAIIALAFSPDGRAVVSVSRDGTVRLWDVMTGETTLTLDAHISSVAAVAFSPDGRVIALAWGRTVRLWDARTGEATWTPGGHILPATAVAISPDGRSVVSAVKDRTMRLWDVRTGKATWTFEGHILRVSEVAFSPDGRAVVSGSDDMTVRLWDVVTGEAMRTLEGHILPVRAVAFSPDGWTVASASTDGTARLWDVRTGKATHTLDGRSDAVRALTFYPEGQSGWVTAVAFSPDGRAVASASRDGAVRLWDARTGEATKTLKRHSDSVTAVTFSPDGRAMASASWDSTVRLWDVTTGEAVHVFNTNIFIDKFAYTRDGKSLETLHENLDITSSVSSGSTRTLGLGRRYEWLTCWDQDFLWLPEEYRAIYASYRNVHIIGQTAEAMLSLEIASMVTSNEDWNSVESLERLLS